MGWWDNDDEKDDSNINYKSGSTIKTSSTTRQCKPDPEDQNFMICKNIVKEISTINGKRNEESKEFEERVPLQGRQRMIQNQNQNNLDHDFFNMDDEVGQMFENLTNSFFKGFPSVVFGPMTFEFNNPNHNPDARRPPQKQHFQQPHQYDKPSNKDDIYDC